MVIFGDLIAFCVCCLVCLIFCFEFFAFLLLSIRYDALSGYLYQVYTPFCFEFQVFISFNALYFVEIIFSLQIVHF